MRLELSNAPYAHRHNELFSGILLENVNEEHVAFEATKRALLRARMLYKWGLFWSPAQPDERHTGLNQILIRQGPRLSHLDRINYAAASAITTAKASGREDIPLYVWYGRQPDILASAITDFNEPFKAAKGPVKSDPTSLSEEAGGLFDIFVPELMAQIREANPK
jgi:hypothetical protein